MKRLLLGVTIFGGAALLGGCPIYPDQRSYQVCGECCSSADCGPGASCTLDGQCVPDEVDASTGGACGECPVGTACTLAGGALQCLPTQGGARDAGVASVDSGAPPFTTPVTDAAPDAVSSPESGTTGGPCNGDSQCAGASGSKCIDGLCAPQSQLCSDGTQCVVAGESCVDGVCVPTCGASDPPCPTGYQCDFSGNRNVCAVNPSACAQTSDCKGGAVCVETRCVAPCGSAEAGAQCPAGQVCVNGGCIPDQQARFTCQNDGSLGALASTCDPGSLCLNGDCYPTCDVDAGGCAAASDACKSVTIQRVTYAVCAPAANLGADCNPAAGTYCDASSNECIDGYCR
jgi:hypothetical protein